MRPPESFVGQPIRSLQTMLRVIAEDDTTRPSVIPDGIYGLQTVRAIADLQRREGLPVTGETDQDTWEVIYALYEPALIRLDAAQPLNILLEPGEVIEAGQTHPNIYIVQGILLVFSEAYGAPKVSATGVLDAETSLALREFQRVNGLPQTGQLDKLTWRLLALQYPLAADTLLGSQQS